MKALTASKIVLACTAVGVLVAIAGKDVFPSVPTATLLVYVACFGVLALVFIALLALFSQAWNRFSLNRGATDPQWMWFGGEPPGLQKERRRNGNEDQTSTDTESNLAQDRKDKN